MINIFIAQKISKFKYSQACSSILINLQPQLQNLYQIHLDRHNHMCYIQYYNPQQENTSPFLSSALLTQKKITLQTAEQYTQSGLILDNLCQNSDAAYCFNKAIQINPKFIPAYFFLADLYGQKQIKKKIRCYRQLIINVFQKQQIFSKLGAAVMRTKKMEQAIQCYQNTLQFNRQHSLAYHLLGLAYRMEQPQSEKAQECFKKAIEINPQNAQAYIGLAAALVACKKINLGIEQFYKSIQISPSPQAYLLLGHTYQEHNKLNQALQCYYKTLELYPQSYQLLAIIDEVITLKNYK